MELNVKNAATNSVETKSSENQTKPSFVRDMIPHRRVSFRICKNRDCGKMYILSDNDAIYYITKYGSLPLKCDDCRRKSREYSDSLKDKEECSE